jgi:hypothetical protein
LSYLEELEHTYELTKGIKTTEPKLLLAIAKEWAENTALKTLFAERRTKMTNATIDVTKRWIEVFDNLVKTHQ